MERPATTLVAGKLLDQLFELADPVTEPLLGFQGVTLQLILIHLALNRVTYAGHELEGIDWLDQNFRTW